METKNRENLKNGGMNSNIAVRNATEGKKNIDKECFCTKPFCQYIIL